MNIFTFQIKHITFDTLIYLIIYNFCAPKELLDLYNVLNKLYLYHHPMKEKSFFLFYHNLILYIAVKGNIVCALTLCKCDIANMIPLYLYPDEKKIYFYHFLIISNMKYTIHSSQRNPVHKRFFKVHDKGKCIKSFSMPLSVWLSG